MIEEQKIITAISIVSYLVHLFYQITADFKTLNKTKQNESKEEKPQLKSGTDLGLYDSDEIPYKDYIAIEKRDWTK